MNVCYSIGIRQPVIWGNSALGQSTYYPPLTTRFSNLLRNRETNLMESNLGKLIGLFFVLAAALAAALAQGRIGGVQVDPLSARHGCLQAVRLLCSAACDPMLPCICTAYASAGFQL